MKKTKFLELHARIMEFTKILLFHMIISKNHANHTIPHENYDNYESTRIPLENQKNNANHKISLENH